MSIVSGATVVRYLQSIRFGKSINGELFKNSKTGIHKKESFRNLFEKYEQEPRAMERQFGKPIKAIDLINKRNNEIGRLLKQFPANDVQFNLLKKESKELTALLKNDGALFSIGLERVTESQAINSDTYGNRGGRFL